MIFRRARTPRPSSQFPRPWDWPALRQRLLMFAEYGDVVLPAHGEYPRALQPASGFFDRLEDLAQRARQWQKEPAPARDSASTDAEFLYLIKGTLKGEQITYLGPFRGRRLQQRMQDGTLVLYSPLPDLHGLIQPGERLLGSFHAHLGPGRKPAQGFAAEDFIALLRDPAEMFMLLVTPRVNFAAFRSRETLPLMQNGGLAVFAETYVPRAAKSPWAANVEIAQNFDLALYRGPARKGHAQGAAMVREV